MRECELIAAWIVDLLRGSIAYDRKEIAMRVLASMMMAIAMLSMTGPVHAQTYDPNYPVCLHVVDWGGSYEDCRYRTMAQCAMSAAGVAATCMMNPFYKGSTSQRRDANDDDARTPAPLTTRTRRISPARYRYLACVDAAGASGRTGLAG
jgi:hypothetical protein